MTAESSLRSSWPLAPASPPSVSADVRAAKPRRFLSGASSFPAEQATVRLRSTTDNARKSSTATGVGYHDHNWGNARCSP